MRERLAGAAGRLAAAPVALVLISITTVQVGSSLAKDLYAHTVPLAVVWLRVVAAAVILGLVTRPRLRGRTASDWGWVLAYGLGMVGMNATFYLAIERIPIGMAVTLEFLGPLGVSVAKSRRVGDFVWVALAAAGVVLLGFSPGELDPVGVLLALAAAALWGAYILLAGPTGRRWSGVDGVAVAFWVGALALTPLVAGMGALPDADARVWAVGLLIGLLSSVIPYGLEMVALRRMEPRVFGILMSVEPAAAALFALLMLGETLRPVEVAAMACVVVASIGVVRGARTPRASDPPKEPGRA